MISFDKIYDMALIVIQDYRLEKLNERNQEAFVALMNSMLITSIPDFNGCLTNLSYEKKQEQIMENGEPKMIDKYYFTNDLSPKEISILAKIVVYTWFKRQTQDIRQIELHLSGRAFNVKSEQANLKVKSEYLDKLKEDYIQEINEYQLENLDKLSFFSY